MFATSIPDPDQSYRAFPVLLFAEFRQEAEIAWQPVKQSSPEDPAISMVTAETMLRTLPYPLCLKQKLNRWWISIRIIRICQLA